ncbi:uncharacterized protein TM35_000391440 [Trypanosoma theileri]|uniref:Uncharacterized protein n=1 Tax=Trypanosoma theileri TaxID=67003 RepID=A0A1X0NLI6_9TRYP|nr:uncharacterized protein TM35_000391440 [Trypanosoma theileri]ORC84970.1 hypothetical protein TM35_000391440 [Trypanosoma theileri]
MHGSDNSTRQRECVSRDARKMYLTLRVAALLLWVPHTLASLYVLVNMPGFTTTNTTTSILHVLVFSLSVIAITYYVAVYKQCGDCLMIGSWVLGVFSDSIWNMAIVDTGNTFQEGLSTSSSSSSLSTIDVSGSTPQNDFHLLWIVVAMLHGAIGGLLCKLKDMDEDRYYPAHSIGERLYVVVPFCTGQWLSFVLKNGWRGIVVENLTILLSLGMVGYCVISYKLLQEHTSLMRGDLIGFLMELLTTSFGVVFAAVIFGSIFVTMLAIPFLKSLFSLNALVSSLGIVLEVIVYELY